MVLLTKLLSEVFNKNETTAKKPENKPIVQSLFIPIKKKNESAPLSHIKKLRMQMSKQSTKISIIFSTIKIHNNNF